MKDWFVFKNTWKIMCLVAFIIVGFAILGGILSVGGKAVERQVLVNSHQYIEGMQQQARLYEATIAELDIKLRSDPKNREELLLQIQHAQVKLNALKR